MQGTRQRKPTPQGAVTCLHRFVNRHVVQITQLRLPPPVRLQLSVPVLAHDAATQLLSEKLTPFVTRGRLSGTEGMGRFFAAVGEMHKRPGHREHRYEVALCGTEQLVKRCLRRAPAKAD